MGIEGAETAHRAPSPSQRGLVVLVPRGVAFRLRTTGALCAVGGGFAAVRTAIAVAVGAAFAAVALMLTLLLMLAVVALLVLGVALMLTLLVLAMVGRRLGGGGLRHGRRGDRKRDRGNEELHVKSPG